MAGAERTVGDIVLGIEFGAARLELTALDLGDGSVFGAWSASAAMSDGMPGPSLFDEALHELGLSGRVLRRATTSMEGSEAAVSRQMGDSPAVVLVGYAARDVDRVRGVVGDAVVLVSVAGGPDGHGVEAATLDEVALTSEIGNLAPDIKAIGVVADFAGRNDSHEERVRDLASETLPEALVICSHQCSADGLLGRAEAVVGALRQAGTSLPLVACTAESLSAAGIDAPLFVAAVDRYLAPAADVGRVPLDVLDDSASGADAGAFNASTWPLAAASSTVTAPRRGLFRVHAGGAPITFYDLSVARDHAARLLRSRVEDRHRAGGAGEVRTSEAWVERRATVAGRPLFVEATLTVRGEGLLEP